MMIKVATATAAAAADVKLLITDDVIAYIRLHAFLFLLEDV